MSTNVALVGAQCEASGHPGACSEPAPGSVTATADAILSVEDTDVGSHATAAMHYPSHGHATDPEGNCINYQEHSIEPDQEHILRVNGEPVMLTGDSTTDPGSGGTAEIIGDGGNTILSITTDTA